MTVWAEESWTPVTPDSPWHSVLSYMGLIGSDTPGTWEMRGADPSLAPVLDWTTLDSSTLEQIRRALSQAQQPVGFRLGGAELRFTPKRVRRSGASRLRRLGTVILGILVKYKLVLVFLSVFVSLLVYGIAFGWAYGAGLIGLIIVHEFGHLVANRIKHIPSSLPIFIPLLGAFIQIKRFPQNAADEAFIGVMGPLFGLGATLIALGLAFVTHEPFFLAVALMGFLLHVFNLMPVLPLDGGRTVGFWRWKAWIPGMVGVLVVMFYNPIDNRFTFDPLAVFIVAIIILSMRREPRMHSDQYTAISARSRWLYTSLWGFALALSIAGYWGIGQLAQVRPL